MPEFWDWLEKDPRTMDFRRPGSRALDPAGVREFIFHDYGQPPAKIEPGMLMPYHIGVTPEGKYVLGHGRDQMAPHAFHSNPNSYGVAYIAPVGSELTPEARTAMSDVYSRARAAYPEHRFRTHGEAFRDTRGTPLQASRFGRGMDEARWLASLRDGPTQPPVQVAAAPPTTTMPPETTPRTADRDAWSQPAENTTVAPTTTAQLTPPRAPVDPFAPVTSVTTTGDADPSTSWRTPDRVVGDALFGSEDPNKPGNRMGGLFGQLAQTEQQAQRQGGQQPESAAPAPVMQSAGRLNDLLSKLMGGAKVARSGGPILSPGEDIYRRNGGSVIANALRVAAKHTDTNPTDKQKEAGNYRKGRIVFNGLSIAIENPKGSMRSGVDGSGKRWSCKLPAHYGYFERTQGYDGDAVDCYIGPAHDADQVYVVNQVDARTKKFDEHKCMLCFPSKAAAQEAYEKAFSDHKGGDRIGSVSVMEFDDFTKWLKSGAAKKGAVKRAAGGPVGRPPTWLNEPALYLDIGERPPSRSLQPRVPLNDRVDANLGLSQRSSPSDQHIEGLRSLPPGDWEPLPPAHASGGEANRALFQDMPPFPFTPQAMAQLQGLFSNVGRSKARAEGGPARLSSIPPRDPLAGTAIDYGETPERTPYANQSLLPDQRGYPSVWTDAVESALPNSAWGRQVAAPVNAALNYLSPSSLAYQSGRELAEGDRQGDPWRTALGAAGVIPLGGFAAHEIRQGVNAGRDYALARYMHHRYPDEISAFRPMSPHTGPTSEIIGMQEGMRHPREVFPSGAPPSGAANSNVHARAGAHFDVDIAGEIARMRAQPQDYLGATRRQVSGEEGDRLAREARERFRVIEGSRKASGGPAGLDFYTAMLGFDYDPFWKAVIASQQMTAEGQGEAS